MLKPKVYQYKRYVYEILPTSKKFYILCYILLAQKKCNNSYVKNAEQINILYIY